MIVLIYCPTFLILNVSCNLRKMKNIILILFLLIFFGCNDQNSKLEDLEKIKSLEHNIIDLKKEITEIKSINKLLNESNEEPSTEESYTEEFNVPLVLTNYKKFSSSKEFNFKLDSTDEYWNRNNYFTGERSHEFFYNVKACLIDDKLKFYFIGVKFPLEDNLIANLYELDENKNLYTIDTIDLNANRNQWKEHGIMNESGNHDRLFNYFMLFQLDNLVIKDEKLYYSKIKKIKGLGEKGFEVDGKEYYEYSISSKEKSLKLERQLTNFISSDIMTFSSNLSYTINPNRTKVVVRSDFLADDSQSISFHKINNWNEILTTIHNHSVDVFNEASEINFDFSKYFNFNKETYEYIDLETNDKILFGGISWHSSGNILYFDDRGGDYKSIWKIDFKNNLVSKIIPENGAMHPFFFKINEKEYVTYVEKNKIMISESPDNEKTANRVDSSD